jgi:hypothetical protein
LHRFGHPSPRKVDRSGISGAGLRGTAGLEAITTFDHGWLIRVVGEDDRTLVGRQSGGYPLLVLYSEDLQAVQDRLRMLDVRTWDERDDPGSRSLHMADLYGIFAQLRDPQI